MDAFNFSYITVDSPLFEQVIELRYKVFFQPFEVKKEEVRDELEESSLHLAVTVNNELVGYIRLTIVGDHAIISQMVIDEAFRRKGLGKELLNRTLEKITEAGVKKIILNARLKALKFYERSGFKTVGEVFASPKTRVLHMKMEKALS